jgi:hypothetical protein
VTAVPHITLRVPLRTVPWPAGQHGQRPCPVCGKPWTPGAQSYWPCHPGCIAPEAEVEAVLEAVDRGEVELQDVYAAWRADHGMTDRYARQILDAARSRRERG